MAIIKHLWSCSIATALLLSRFATAWTSSSLVADLAWPPIGNQGYVVEDGRRLGPNIDAFVFPCWNVTPPKSPSARKDFALTGNRLQINLENTTTNTEDYKFMVNIYLGQFSNDASPGKTGWVYIDTLVYDNITSGYDCTNAYNITNEILGAPRFDIELTKNITTENLVGVNLTMGVRTILFKDNDNMEEMYQCSYLRLVDDDAPVTQDRGSCNSGPSPASPSPSSSSHTSTASATAASTSSGTGHTASTIGIAAGTVVGVAVLIVVLGFFFLRRRRSRKSRGLVTSDFNHANRPTGFERIDEDLGRQTKKNGARVESWGMSNLGSKEKNAKGPTVTSGEVSPSSPLPAYKL